MKTKMSFGRILLILLFVRNCEGFFNIDLSKLNNGTMNRLNLTCSTGNGFETNCEYCVYQYYSNGSSSMIIYDCIIITNSYQSYKNQCEGFSDQTDIGYGICSPLSFELFDLSVLCICATNMCNNNLTICQSSINEQIQSNSAPSVLPSIIPDLSQPISCFDTMFGISNSSTTDYYCLSSSSPYINITKCNEYVINKTVLCVYYASDNQILSLALTEDSYRMFLSNIINGMNPNNQDYPIQQFFNQTSSYFYLNWRITFVNSTSILDRCICAQDNCNTNLTNCLNANRSITVENNATRNSIFVTFWIDMIIKFSLIFIATKTISSI